MHTEQKLIATKVSLHIAKLVYTVGDARKTFDSVLSLRICNGIVFQRKVVLTKNDLQELMVPWD